MTAVAMLVPERPVAGSATLVVVFAAPLAAAVVVTAADVVVASTPGATPGPRRG
jgi:hypothetical protein